MEFKAKVNAFQGLDGTMFNVLSLARIRDIELDATKTYRVTIKEWKDKRSLDANAYMWQLLTKLGHVLHTSADELYEDYLQKYGLLDNEVIVTVKSTVDMSRIEGHWRYLKASSDGKWKSYIKVRGTSEYDSKEMAHFIEFIVDDCKEQGIETLTPEELAQLRGLV